MMGAVMVVLVTGVTVFCVRHYKSKQPQNERGSDEPQRESQTGGNSQFQSSAPQQCENHPQGDLLHNGSSIGRLHGHSRNSSIDNIPYECPNDLNGHADKNSNDLNVDQPTDNSLYENPEALTHEYFTILTDCDIIIENAHALTNQYENSRGRNSQYDPIDMDNVSEIVNPYEEIRH